MNCVQICLVLAAGCSMLVSANKGSYSYGYGVNDPMTGDLKEQHEPKDCDQVSGYYKTLDADNMLRTVNYKSHPLTGFEAQVSREPIAPAVRNSVSASPASILRTVNFEPARILAAAAPILEAKIEAEPVVYAARSEFAPIPKYAPRPEYFAASPAPLVAPKIQIQAAPERIIESEPIRSYRPQATSFSYKSSVDHQQSAIKIAAAAPQYYLDAPAAPIAVTASPILETKIAFAPMPKYAPRPQYFAASPAPLVAPKIQIQAAPERIIESEPIRSYRPQATSFSYKSSVDHQQSAIKIAAAAPQYYAAAPAAPIVVTASPILETKIEAEPIAYAARSEFAPMPKYAPRPQYFAASPAPLVAPKIQIQAAPQYYAAAPSAPIAVTASPILETKIIEAKPVVYAARSEFAPMPKYAPRPEYFAASPAPLVAPKIQIQAAPERIIKSSSPQVTSFSYKSSVDHQQSPIAIAVAAPQYYAAAPQYNTDAPAAPIALKMAQPEIRALSGPSAPSYQYADQWNNYEQPAAAGFQSRYSVASPVYYSAAAAVPEAHSSGTDFSLVFTNFIRNK